ncbi:MarR family winged helix-turn-helix transcriptional regulator [Arthrobacter sp. ISL-69]|uniref:MarR family winged helix-turn-helix transcriptional regulator n=1 Tax=Arthrobacter sp. ISL-69 TaxID=2819113 RepID=UPI001BEC9ABB|nr:MarR family winged helix-turn-helix transcriptional regulator [Arthrobacter sp. ISL-69]MBT2539020.1 winged helix-turn-helix transcriptional regulator [Arthrobacter sp. ISL-69]
MAGTIAQLDGTCNCFALRKASRYLTAAYDQALAPTGLRATQFTILQKTASQGALSVTELAEIMAMDRTTLATNLKPLARAGLVTVEPSEQDRRKKMTRITDAGLAKFEESLALWSGAQDKFEHNYGEAKAAELRRMLSLVLGTGFDPWTA